MNRDNHDKMYFNTGVFWENSAQQGSWMIRPVMASVVDPFIGIAESTTSEQKLVAFPNPASESFKLMATTSNNKYKAMHVEMCDMMGCTKRMWDIGDAEFNVNDVVPGLYYLRVTDREGHVLGISKMAIVH
jgi:hypothetical protein